MAQLDRLDGDIDTLMTRLAYIRTWTYVTHRADWTDNPAEWQDRARSIEDRLSTVFMNACQSGSSTGVPRTKLKETRISWPR